MANDSQKAVRLTVVVPTRGRPDLALRAIASILESESDAVRVVVSDNSGAGAQRDALAAGVQQFADARVEFVRAPDELSMTDHWNFALERALADAATTHVAFLSDRMVFKPAAVDLLVRVLREHPEYPLIYPDEWIEDDRRPVQLVQMRWSGELAEVPSTRLLERTARSQLHPAPRLLNSAVPRFAFDRIRRQWGAVFGSASPDYAFAYRCLWAVDRVRYFDRGLVIHYARARSNGFAFARGDVTPEREHFLASLPESPTRYAPIPELLTVNNGPIHEYCRVQQETGSDKFPPVDRARYLQLLATDIANMTNATTRAEYERRLAAHGTPRRAPSLLRFLQNVLSFPGRRLPRFWKAVANVTGLYPPGDAPLPFDDVDAALRFVQRKPRRRHLTSAHIRVLLGDYVRVARY